MKSAAPPTESALFWTFVIAVIAALCVAAGARVADRVLAGYEAQNRDYAIVRVVAPDGDDAVGTAEAALAHAPGVTHAARMTQARAAQLLRDAGGSETSLENLPALRLIELDLAPGTDAEALAHDLNARLEQAGVTAEVLHAPQPGGGAARIMRLAPTLIQAGAIGFALVLAAIAGLAARGIAGRRADLIQVMADLGATRGQTSKRVGDEAGALGFGAGLVAAILVAGSAAGAYLVLIPNASLDALPRMLGPLDIAPFALAPFFAAFVAGGGARAAADSLYAEAARLA